MDPRFTPEFQRRTILKISRRLLPLVVVSYLVAYTGSFEMGLYFLAACALSSALIAFGAIRATDTRKALQGGRAQQAAAR